MNSRVKFFCRPLILHVGMAWIVFCTMAGVKTYPLVLHLSDHIGDLGDPLLNAWILAWDYHALLTDPWNLFNANILYPAPKSLAFSEHLLGVLPIFAPAYALTGNPIFAYNVVFFLSFPLCGLAMFLLVYYWTGNSWASLLAGFLFAFAPVRLAQFSHLQLCNLFWAPLALLFLDKFLRHRQWRDLTIFAVLYWLQVLSSVYLGWFTTVAVTIYVLSYVVVVDRTLFNRSLLPYFGAFTVTSLLVLLPIHLPYFQVKQEWGMSRPLEECVFYSAEPFFSYITPPFVVNQRFHAFLKFAESRFAGHEKMLFPGLIAPILVIVGTIGVGPKLRFGEIIHLRWLFGLILVASFLLSLGPYLIINDRNTEIPLPYYLLYQVIPGFQAMRAPARFALMASLAACVLAAIGYLRLCHVFQTRYGFEARRTSALQGMLALVILGLFILEVGFKPLPIARTQSPQEVPEVYRWLATQPHQGALVELPMGLWEDYRYTYYSTYHWRPIVNGTSGFMPPTYRQLAATLKVLPMGPGIEQLRAIGVSTLILHRDRLTPAVAAQWEHVDPAALGLEKVAAFGDDIVYKLPQVETFPPPYAELMLNQHLPVNTRVTLGLLLDGIRYDLAASPRLLERTSGLVTWTEQGTENTSRQRIRLTLSLPRTASGMSRQSLSVQTPPSPGFYWLKVALPGLMLETTPQLVEVRDGSFPTSLSSPALLSATYELVEHPPDQVGLSMPLSVALKVRNTGEAVWLARAANDKGAVRLGWRWFEGEQEVPETSRREPLQYDVFPGDSYVFEVHVNTPPRPGVYTLELGLVSEHVAWFMDRNVTPLKLSIRILDESAMTR